jgi:predicted metal-binding protein
MLLVHEHYSRECSQLNKAISKKQKKIKELEKKLLMKKDDNDIRVITQHNHFGESYFPGSCPACKQLEESKSKPIKKED